jgi:cyanate permease
VIWANYFGRKYLGAIVGVASTFGAAASGVGPLIYGVGRDLSGTYWPSLLLSAVFPATLAVAVLFMRRPVR